MSTGLIISGLVFVGLLAVARALLGMHDHLTKVYRKDDPFSFWID